MLLVIIILVLIFIRELASQIGKIKVIVLALALALTNYLFFVTKYKLLLFCATCIQSPVVANLNNSGVAEKAALGFLNAAALPILLAIFKALTGLLASFFPKLTVALQTLLKKSFNPCFYCCITESH